MENSALLTLSGRRRSVSVSGGGSGTGLTCLVHLAFDAVLINAAVDRQIDDAPDDDNDKECEYRKPQAQELYPSRLRSWPCDPCCKSVPHVRDGYGNPSSTFHELSSLRLTRNLYIIAYFVYFTSPRQKGSHVGVPLDFAHAYLVYFKHEYISRC